MTLRPPGPARFARVRRAEWFVAALQAPSRARTEHFALHHVQPGSRPEDSGLSTTMGTASPLPVDKSPVERAIGVVLPKRHARRAVTRNLIRRQVYAVAAGHGEPLGGGCWVVRLRAPFPAATFVSAASPALRAAARGELIELIGAAGRRAAP